MDNRQIAEQLVELAEQLVEAFPPENVLDLFDLVGKSKNVVMFAYNQRTGEIAASDNPAMAHAFLVAKLLPSEEIDDDNRYSMYTGYWLPDYGLLAVYPRYEPALDRYYDPLPRHFRSITGELGVTSSHEMVI